MSASYLRGRPNVLSRLVLLGIFLVAFGLRIWGVSFELPYRYHPDEWPHVVEAVRMAAARSIKPVTFAWPPFYTYVLLGEYAVYLGIGIATGSYESVHDFGNSITLDPSSLYLLGRITSAIAGAVTVLAVYAIGRIGYNRRVGLIAAWFLAVALLHVRDSHYAVNDALLTFLTTVSLLGAVLITQKGQLRDYLLAGSAAGLAFATKYTAVFLLVAILIAHALSPGVCIRRLSSSRLRSLITGLTMFAVSAIAGSPYFLVAPWKVLQDIVSVSYAYGRQGFAGWQIDPAGGYIFYMKSLWWGLGAGLFFLCLTGVALALVKRRPASLILLSFPALLYLFMGQQKMYFARFILPAVSPLLVLAASAAEDLIEHAARRINMNRAAIFQSTVLLLVAVLVTAQPVASSVRHDYLLTQKDTRTLAKEWIQANIPEGARIAVEWPYHGPPLSTPDDPKPHSDRSYDMWIVGGHGLSDHCLEYYWAESYEYLIASNFIYNIPLTDRHRDIERRAFYASLDQELELVQEFRPYEGDSELPFIFDEVYGPAVSLWQRERPGPTLKIYRVER